MQGKSGTGGMAGWIEILAAIEVFSLTVEVYQKKDCTGGFFFERLTCHRSMSYPLDSYCVRF